MPNMEQGAKVKRHEDLRSDFQKLIGDLKKEIGFLPDHAGLQAIADQDPESSLRPCLDGRKWMAEALKYSRKHKALSRAFSELPAERKLELVQRSFTLLDLRLSTGSRKKYLSIDLDKFGEGLDAARYLGLFEREYLDDCFGDLEKYWSRLEDNRERLSYNLVSRLYCSAVIDAVEKLLDFPIRQQADEISDTLLQLYELARNNGDLRTMSDLAAIGRAIGDRLPRLNLGKPIECA